MAAGIVAAIPPKNKKIKSRFGSGLFLSRLRKNQNQKTTGENPRKIAKKITEKEVPIFNPN